VPNEAEQSDTAQNEAEIPALKEIASTDAPAKAMFELDDAEENSDAQPEAVEPEPVESEGEEEK